MMEKSRQERTAETFDEYGNAYSDTVNQSVAFTGLKVDFFTRVKAIYLEEIASSHFGPGKTVDLLDVGCGTGNLHGLLPADRFSVSGADVSERSIEIARSRNPAVAYMPYDGSRLPYEAATFDMTLAICVVHHVPPDNWKSFFAEMHRVLRPNGLAVIIEHNPRNPLTMRAVNTCPFDEDAVLLKSAETCELLRGSGFRDVRSRYILSLPVFNRITRRMDEALSRVPLGAQYYAVGVR